MGHLNSWANYSFTAISLYCTTTNFAHSVPKMMIWHLAFSSVMRILRIFLIFTTFAKFQIFKKLQSSFLNCKKNAFLQKLTLFFAKQKIAFKNKWVQNLAFLLQGFWRDFYITILSDGNHVIGGFWIVFPYYAKIQVDYLIKCHGQSMVYIA